MSCAELLNAIPKRSTEVWVTLPNGLVRAVTDRSGAGREFEFDPIGSHIWRLCGGELNVRQIVDAILDAVQDPPERGVVVDSVVSFLRELRSEGLVDVDPRQAG